MALNRLRIPKALAVAIVGSSVTLAVSFSCSDSEDGPTPPVEDPSMVAEDDPGVDAAVADAKVDARPDARPDARRDAYVPPDTPVV